MRMWMPAELNQLMRPIRVKTMELKPNSFMETPARPPTDSGSANYNTENSTGRPCKKIAPIMPG